MRKLTVFLLLFLFTIFDVCGDNYWTAPIGIDDTPSGFTYFPGIVYNQVDNSAISVWSDVDTGEIYSNIFDGNSWGAPQLIGSGTNPAVDGVLTFGGQIYAIAVWIDSDNSNALTYAAYKGTSGSTGTWSTPAVFPSAAEATANQVPQIGVNISGDAIVLYLSYNSGTAVSSVQAIVCDVDITDPSWPTWGTPTLLSNGTTTCFSPFLSMQKNVSPTYRTIATWLEGFNTTGTIYGSYYTSTGLPGWSSKATLQTSGVMTAIENLGVAINSTGDTGFALWRYSTDGGSTYSLKASAFKSNLWSSGSVIGSANVGSAVAISSQGIPYAILKTAANGVEIYTGAYDSTYPVITWGGSPVYTASMANASLLKATKDQNGGVMAYWTKLGSDLDTIFSNNSGMTWDPITIETGSSVQAVSIAIGYSNMESITKGISFMGIPIGGNGAAASYYNFSPTPTPPPPPPPPPPGPSTERSFVRPSNRR